MFRIILMLGLALVAMARKAPIPTAANYAQVSQQTIRNWIGRGLLTGYRRGPRLIYVDLDEIDRIDQLVPTTRARTGRKLYGPNSKIVDERHVPTIEAVEQ